MKQEDIRPGTTIFAVTGNYGNPDPSFATITPLVSSITPVEGARAVTGYTLEDIYNIVYNHSTSTGHSITEVTSPADSMYTTTEIYNILRDVKNFNTITANKLKLGNSIFGIAGTFNPSAQFGEYCESSDSCYTGHCGFDQNWNQACTYGNVGDFCNDNSACALGYCDSYNSSQCTTGEIGAYCGNSSGCISGYCDTFNGSGCTDGSVGSGCYSNDACALGHCFYDDQINYTSQCTDGQLNSLCNDPADCDSGFCYFTPVNWDDYTGNTGYCVDGNAGSACNSNTNCGTPNVCDIANSVCVDGSVGASCTSSTGCSSGYCDTFNGICKADGSVGSACGGNSECDTYNCVSNVCSADLPPLTGSLIGYWPLDDVGTSFSDLSSNGNTGTCSACPASTTGKIGGAQNFSGSTYINIGTLADLQGLNSYSIGAWIYITADPSSYDGAIVGSRLWDGPGKIDFSIRGSGTYHLYGDMYGNNTGYPEMGVSTLVKNTWYYVNLVKNGDTTKMYVNGNLDASQFLEGPVTNTGNLSIGDFLNRRFKGKLDEVAIWGRPLAPAEITNLYNSGAGMQIVAH